MTHTIMLIPATLNADITSTTSNLNKLLSKKNIRAAILPEFDLTITEQLLALNRSEDLLANIAKQYEELAPNNNVVIISGISLTKPYAAELNFSIATALGAAIIFVTDMELNSEATLRQLKVVMSPYQYRYKLLILDSVLDKADNFNFDIIQKFLATSITQPITPAIFKHRLIEKAKHANRRIVLPEGDEPRTIAAANICAAQGIAECILLGDKNKILSICAQSNLKLHEKITIIDPQTAIEKYIEPLFELRRAKGMTIEMAKTQLEDHVMLGTMMLHLGEVDGLVSGAVHTTANTIRPALQIIKTSPGAKLVSSVFFMCLPDQVLVYGDCAINPNPNAEELADIAIQSATSALAFGITPKIAMLSYSTGSSGAGEAVDKIKTATEIVKTLRPDLEIEGPIQYDAAISEETAKTKAPNSKVAGHATVFIMPNLDVGNISYKAVQRSTGIVCVGPMLQGLRKPVNDLSRGCLVDDIVFTIAVTAIQALENR